MHNAQRCRCTVNSAKDAVLFYQHFCQNFIEFFRLQLLHQALYFGTFLTDGVAIKGIKSYLRKSCSALELNVGETDPAEECSHRKLCRRCCREKSANDVIGGTEHRTGEHVLTEQ